MRMKKMINLSLSAALLAGMVGLTACGTRTDNNNVRTQSVRNHDGRNYDVNSLPQGNRNFSRSAGSGQNQRIRSLTYSPSLSNKVAGLSDVRSAHVVVTGNDAYVALTLHDKAGTTRTGTTGTTGTGTTGTPGITGTTRGTTGTTSRMSGLSTGLGNTTGTTNYGGPYGAGYGTRGAGDDGLGRGFNGRSGVMGNLFGLGQGGMTGRNTTVPNGTTGYGMGNYGTTGNGYGYGTTGHDYGTGVGAGTMRGAGTGTMRGMGTGTMHNLGNGTTAGRVTDFVPQRVKDEVSRVVKRSAPHIRNVYVSGDTEFVNQVGTYATHSRGGATLHGYIADFETMINRVFPHRTGTMTGPNGYAPTTPNRMHNTTGGAGGAGFTTGGYSGGVTR